MQASSNDAALALIQSGQVDWTHNFVPNVEKAYEAKDQQHYHAFYSNRDYPISLVFDDTQYPYSLVAFRKALSLAIDRNSVWKLGEYGYEPPADAIGLSGLFPQWVTDKAVKAQAKAMATYNPTAAKKMLTDNGFTYKGSDLLDPKGNAVKLDIHVISGWSDWVASNQIITKNFRDIGIDSQVQARARLGRLVPERVLDEEPDAPLAGRLARFAVRLLLRQPVTRTPSSPPGRTRARPGTGSTTSNAKATTLLNQWKVDARREEAAVRSPRSCEKLWLQDLPIIPVMIGARWSTYSTKYFHCFPTKRRTSTPTRSSRRTPTTSSCSPASLPGGKAGI